MKRDAMTSRERWLAVLRRQAPDRLPTDYWTTDEAREKLKRHLGCANDVEIFTRLHIDRKITVEPAYVGPAIPRNADEFGCRFQDMDYGTGKYRECVFHPLAQYGSVAEIQKDYRWPTIDWFDCAALKGRLEGWETQPVQGGLSEPFLTYADLRGREQSLIDLVLNPELVHYCLDKLYTLSWEKARMLYETFPGVVTHGYVAEDMGSQEDLVYSPAQIREFFIPWMKKMIKLMHEAGVFVFHHSDGAIRKIIPDMIEAGIDVLNPVQWRCKGMDREGLERDFGSRLIFHGAVDNQQTLPFGTVEDVRAEVRETLSIFGTGWICAPCHNIQAVSPAENVVALYQAVWEYAQENR
jgi:uroporphyrinogen decarboxylase